MGFFDDSLDRGPALLVGSVFILLCIAAISIVVQVLWWAGKKLFALIPEPPLPPEPVDMDTPELWDDDEDEESEPSESEGVGKYTPEP